jgi:hypothetical protein
LSPRRPPHSRPPSRASAGPLPCSIVSSCHICSAPSPSASHLGLPRSVAVALRLSPAVAVALHPGMDGTGNVAGATPPLGAQGGDAGRGRRLKWTDALDICLLREAKVHKPHAKRYGDRGAAFAAIAGSLNSSQRLPWDTDKSTCKGVYSTELWRDERTSGRAHVRLASRRSTES